MSKKQEIDGKTKSFFGRFDNLLSQQKENKIKQEKIIEEKLKIMNCAEKLFSDPNALRVLKYLFDIKKITCDDTLDINPNRLIFEQGINYFYARIRELVPEKVLYKVEIKGRIK